MRALRGLDSRALLTCHERGEPALDRTCLWRRTVTLAAIYPAYAERNPRRSTRAMTPKPAVATGAVPESLVTDIELRDRCRPPFRGLSPIRQLHWIPLRETSVTESRRRP